MFSPMPRLPGSRFHTPLSSQQVDTLKAFLKSRGLPVGGKKQELVDRVLEALE